MKLRSLFTVVFFLAFAVNTYAQEDNKLIRPYGNLYLFLGLQHEEFYTGGQVKATNSDLYYHIDGNSNLGFVFSYSRYNGVFELGLDDIDNKRKVSVRKAFGEYKVGETTKLMIGQDWSPYVHFSNETADYYRSKGFGSIYEDPNLQISLSAFGFYASILKPFVPVNDYISELDATTPTSGTISTEYTAITTSREKTTGLSLDYVDSYIPKFAAGYEFKNKMLKLNTGGAANLYFIKNTDNVKFNKNYIYSYLFYVNSSVSMYDFSLTVSGGYLVNPANFGIYVQSAGNSTYTGGAAAALQNIATGKYEIKDTWNAQGFAELEYRFTEKFIAHAGYGYSIVKYPIKGAESDSAMEYYLNCKFIIGGLIALTPSVSIHNYLKDMSGHKEGYDVTSGILATISYF
jgi:hypothetical protein